MAVWLLAGPFKTTRTEALPKADGSVPVPPVVQANVITWWPGVGMIAEVSPGGWYSVPSGVMTLDGRFCDRARDQWMGSAGYWPDRNAMVYWPWSNFGPVKELIFEPITFAVEKAGPEPPLPSHPLELRNYIKLMDRCIYFNGDYFTDKGAFTVVVGNVVVGTEGPKAPFASGRVHPGRSRTEVFVSEFGYSGTTRGVFYDTVTKQWSSPVFTIGRRCTALVYSTDWNVLISGHSYGSDPDELTTTDSNQIRIWALQVHPTIVKVPEVFDGEVKSGQVVVYRVQVLGDDKDAAEGEFVNWALTGAGTLLTVQSQTDIDGYAMAQVQYGIQETGQSTVIATLLC